MDSAAIRSRSRRSRAARLAIWHGVAEALEPRRLLSDSTGGAVGQAVTAFIENRGQWTDPGIRYALPGNTGNIFMTDDGPIFQLFQTQPDGTTYSEAFFVTFDGGNKVRPTGVDKAAGVNNFFIGDQSNWRTNVPGYDQIAYKNVYDGIDLYTWGKSNSLKYEFHVDPGVDWTQVQISYSGIQGLSIDEKGRLHIKSTLGEFVDDAPFVYQVIDGKRVEIDSSFRLVDSDTYTFELHEAYDPRYELVLDPAIDWSTYFGAEDEDRIHAVTTDIGGGMVVSYVAGYTAAGLFFPSRNGLQVLPPILPYDADNDAFVAKFNSSGQLLWNTFLGGADDDDQANDIAVDAFGRVVVVGQTDSSDFGFTPGAHQTQLDGTGDNNGTSAFLARLSPNGLLQYSSYYGGGAVDAFNAVAVDGNIIYTVGRTSSDGLATLLPDLITTTTRRGGQDGIITKWDLDAVTDVVWSRYIGGTGNADLINDVTIAPNGDLFVIGNTNSNNNNDANPPVPVGSFDHFVTIGSFSPTYGGGNSDAWMSRINSDAVLLYGTYLGGGGVDSGNAIAIRDDGQQVAVTGQTGSTDFDIFPFAPTPPNVAPWPISIPVPPPIPPTNARQGNNDAFVAKFNITPGNVSISMSAYLGGTGNGDTGVGVAYSGSNLVIVGNTDSGTSFPYYDTNGFRGVQENPLGGLEVFVMSISSTNLINYSFPFGGPAADTATDVAIDEAGAIWVVGYTESANAELPAFGFNLGQYRTDGGSALIPLIAIRPGDEDGFIAHFSENLGAAPVAAASNVRATALSSSSVRVTWNDNSDNETGFLIRRKLGAGGTYVSVGQVGPNIRTFTDEGLLPSTTYYYIVYAFNLTGFSAVSNAAPVTTRTASLGTPTNLSATAISSSRIDLSWTDNADNETAIEIYRSEGDLGIFSLIATLGPNLTTYSDTNGLSPGTLYSYRIRMINNFQASSFSEDASATTLGGAFMIPPTNLVGTPLSATSVQLTWVDNSDNELGFSIERSIFGTGVFNEIGTTGAGETVFIDGTAVAGVNYTYRVRAFNASGFSGYTNTANSDPALALATPTLVEARATGANTIFLTWFDKAMIETGYVIERAIGAPSDFNVIATTGPNTTSFLDSNLLPRTRYYYRVSATDGNVSSAESAVASATTLATGFFPPPAPTVIRGKALSFSSVQITWQDNSSTETAFSIERGTALEGPYVTVGTVLANVNKYIDTGLQDGTMYYYRVVARQGTTESLPSTIIKVRTIVRPRIVVNAVDGVGAEPNNRLVFNIRRKDSFDGDLVVVYSLTGSAVNGTDYNRLTGTVTIPDGQPTADVIVTPRDDTGVEGTETVILTLVNNAAYKVSPSLRSAQGTIADNDGVSAQSLRTQEAAESTKRKVFSNRTLSAWKLVSDTL